ncbi:MAG: NusG domain II-containing protein [Candidatus Latescibacteria bacterium]|nr:NusG domain II-containing protein [Candidatus Latescibacterota bacterium]
MLVLAGLCLGSWVVLGRRPAGTVLVLDSPGQSQRHPLAEDQVLLVGGPLGFSRVAIQGGQACFVSSPCPEQRCVSQGWIRRQGETAACLPNQIALHIEGPGAVDALSR